MICPHCKKQISDKDVAAHLGSKGGGFREGVDYAKLSAMRTERKGWPKGKPRKNPTPKPRKEK